MPSTRMLENHALSQERQKRIFIQAAWDACHDGKQTEVFQIFSDPESSGIERLKELCGADLILSADAGNQRFMVS